MLEELKKNLEVQKEILKQAKEKAYAEENRRDLLNALVTLGDTSDSNPTVMLTITNTLVELSTKDYSGYGGRMARVVITPEIRLRIAEAIAEILSVSDQ